MDLLLNAGEVVMWCIAIVLFAGFASIGALWAWDRWTDWRWEQRRAKR